jgi:hypothetical protein
MYDMLQQSSALDFCPQIVFTGMIILINRDYFLKASCTMGTGGPFPGNKARPGRDADYSPLARAEVVNE